MKTPTVIITGAGQRIGLSLTKFFLEKDFNVIAISRNEHENLTKLKEYYSKLGIQYHDFLTYSFTENFWNSIEDLKAFIHCASTFYEDNIFNVESSILNEQKIINCDTFIHACTSIMKSNNNYSNPPAFIAFLDAKLDNLNKSHYSYTLSKLQLKSSIPFLAMSCSPKIRVNSISPGLTLPSGEQTIEQFNNAQKSLPFGFGVKIEDISETVSFIVNNTSLVGQNITIDAGQHLQSCEDIIHRFT